MEFSWLRRPTTAAADDVETGRLRRFPDVPPTPHGDANASPADAPTLARREELVWELNKSRIQQDMILRELIEMEHAMGFTAAGNNPVPRLQPSQDYWRSRTPSAPPLEDSPPRSSTEHPPCGSRGPAAARVPPVYPHVDWPPAPSLQPRPASDTGKQQDWGSSGARTHPFDGYVELHRSPNKPTLAEVSTAATSNAGTRPMFHEVRLGHKDERKAVVEDSHGVHPLYESGNRRNWQGKTEETIKVNQINGPMLQSGQHGLAGQERASFDQQKGREFTLLMPEQPRLGNGPEQQQECRSPGARLHMFDGHAELCLSPTKQALVEETLVPVAAKGSISPVRSALSFGKEAASRHQQAFAGEPKADVEDDHGMHPLGEISNQINGQRKAVESAMEGPADKPTQPQPVGLQNVAYNEQKVESNEADVEDGEISNQSNGQRRAVEPAMEGSADKPTQPQPTGLQNVAYNEQKKVESNESLHERATTGVKRKLDAEASSVKKQKPWPWCTICHVKMPTLHHLKEHLASKLHRSNLTALQSSRNGAAEPNTTWSPPAWAVAATSTNSLPRDGKENAVEGSMSQQGGKPHLKNSNTAKKADWKRAFYCKLCDVQCNGEKMLASHLGGRKHRERLEGSD